VPQIQALSDFVPSFPSFGHGFDSHHPRMIYPGPDPLPVFPDMKFPIRTCGGTPIEYEVVMTGGMKKP
jgi:hypothetical protein